MEIEKIVSVFALDEKYREIGYERKPKKNDLVFVPSLKAVFDVESVKGLLVTIERKHKGSGHTMSLPPSQYRLIEKIK